MSTREGIHTIKKEPVSLQVCPLRCTRQRPQMRWSEASSVRARACRRYTVLDCCRNSRRCRSWQGRAAATAYEAPRVPDQVAQPSATEHVCTLRTKSQVTQGCLALAPSTLGMAMTKTFTRMVQHLMTRGRLYKVLKEQVVALTVSPATRRASWKASYWRYTQCGHADSAALSPTPASHQTPKELQRPPRPPPAPPLPPPLLVLQGPPLVRAVCHCQPPFDPPRCAHTFNSSWRAQGSRHWLTRSLPLRLAHYW